MKTIVCFGDSNTWGADPAGSGRFGYDVRWTGVLRNELGSEYRVIEEGLNGRTTTVDDTINPGKNGRDYLMPCLETHWPIDLITIMLGTNDLKTRFNRSASDIAESAGVLAKLAADSKYGVDGAPPKVLLIAPPPIVALTDLDEMFDGALEKSQKFTRYYPVMIQGQKIDFLDAGSVIQSSEVDGIHFDAREHGMLGKAIAAKIKEIMSR